MTVRRLHLGDFHPDLEAAFQRSLSALCPDGDARGVLVVVPNRLLGTHLRRRAAELGRPTLGLDPRSLEDLTEELAAPLLAARAARRLPDWAVSLVLAELPPRGALPAGAGWSRALAATVRDLRDAGVEAAELDGAARAAGLDADRRVAALVALYAAYLARLRRRPRFADDAAVSAAAVEAIAAGAVLAGGAPPRALLLYGFYELVGRQRDVVAALLADRAVDCQVFFPWGSGPAFDYVEPLKKWLQGELGFEPWHEDPVLPYSNLLALRRRLFAPPPPSEQSAERTSERPAELPPDQPDTSVRWLSAPTESSEPLEVLRSLATLPASSALVVLRQREPAAERYRAVARATSLRVHLAAAPLRRGGVGRAALALLRLARSVGAESRNEAERSLPRAAVEELLASGGLSATVLPAESRPERWIQALRGRGLVAGLEGWRRFIARHGTATESAQGRLPFGSAPTPAVVDEDDEDRERDARLARELPVLADWMGRLIETLEELAAEPRTWSRRAAGAAEVLATWLEAGPDLELWRDGIRNLGGLDGLLPATFANFVTACEELGEAAGAGAGERARFGDAPTIAGLAEVRGVTADRVVLPALLERSFPRRAAEDPLLLDAERRRLNETLPRSLPLKKADSLAEERLLFRLVLGSVRREVCFSWPRRGEDGRPLVPSSFLTEAAAALFQRHVRFDELEGLPGVERVPLRAAERADAVASTALLGSEVDLRAVAAARRGGDPAGLGALLAAHPGLGPSLRAEWERRGAGHAHRLSRYDGLVEEALALAWLERRRDAATGALRVSPSALQTYAECSFRFLHRYVLGISAHAAPERRLDLDPGTTGAIYHAALRDLFARLLEENLWPLSDPDRRARAAALIEPVLDDLVRRRALAVDDLAPALWQAHRRRAMEDLRRVLDEEARDSAGWRPVHLEFDVGGGAPRPVEIGGVTVRLSGRIDRVDEGPLGVRIVDYKTGRHNPERAPAPGSIRGGKSMQLPLYRLAWEARVEGSPAAGRPFHGSYRGVSRQSEFRDSAWTPSDFATADGALAATVPAMSAGIAQGEFFQVESTAFCDGWCDFRSICGPGRTRLVTGKQSDPRVERAALWRGDQGAAPDEGRGEREGEEA